VFHIQTGYIPSASSRSEASANLFCVAGGGGVIDTSNLLGK